MVLIDNAQNEKKTYIGDNFKNAENQAGADLQKTEEAKVITEPVATEEPVVTSTEPVTSSITTPPQPTGGTITTETPNIAPATGQGDIPGVVPDTRYDKKVEDGARIPGVTEGPAVTKNLDTFEDLGGVFKEAFIRGNESGKTNQEIVDGIRARLANQGYDMADFDKRISNYVKDFGNLNLSTDDFFKGLSNGETYGKWYEKNSVDYQQGKKLFDSYNNLDKSKEGIKKALKDGSLVGGLLDIVNKDPQLAAFIKEATNEKIEAEVNEVIENGTVEDVLSLSNAGTALYVKKMFDKFGLNKSFEDQLKNNKELSNFQKGYLDDTKEIIRLENEKKTLLDKIKKNNPGASMSTIYRIYKAENTALEDQINTAKGNAELNMTGYNLELNTTLKGIEYNTLQSDKAFAEYKDIYDNQFGVYSAESAQKRAIEMQNLNDGNVKSWIYDKDGNLTGVDENGKVVSTLEGYKNTDPTQTEGLVASWIYDKDGNLTGVDKKGNIVSTHTGYTEELVKKDEKSSFIEVGNKIYDDGSSTVIYYDANTKQLVNKQFGPKGEDLVVNGWAEDLLSGKKANYGGDYDNWTGLDIALPYQSDFTSPVNGTVLEYKENNGDYGNSLIIEDADGNIIQFNHLYSSSLKAGSPIGAGTILGKVGNSGYVLKSDETVPSPSELAAGRGSHLDIVTWEKGVTNRNKNNARTSEETEAFLNGFDGKKSEKTNGLTREQNIMIGGLTKELFGANASDNDRELVETIIKAFPEGTSRNDVALAVKDFKFDDPIKTDNAMTLLNKVRTKFPIADIDLASLASFIRDGNYDGAIRNIEDKMLSKIPEDSLIRESKVKYTVDRVKELENLVSKGEKIIGPVDGTLENWLKKLKSPEASAIKQKITYLVADMRNRLSGTAVTADESAFLEPIIPDLSDKSDVIKNKISDLSRVPIEQLNALRNEIGLPSLKSNQIGNYNIANRLDLYTNPTTPKEYITPATPTTLISNKNDYKNAISSIGISTNNTTTTISKDRVKEGLDFLNK